MFNKIYFNKEYNKYMNKQIKCLLLEFDGVILETDIYHFLSWKVALAEHKIKIDPSFKEMIKGIDKKTSLKKILERLHSDLTEKEIEEITIRKNDIFKEYVKDITSKDLFPKIEEALNWVKQNNIKVGIITTSTNAKDLIKQMKLDKMVDSVICTMDVKGQSYLDKEILIDSVKELGIKQWETVAFLGSQGSIDEANECLIKTIAIDFDKRLKRANLNLTTTLNIDEEFLFKIFYKLPIEEIF